MVHLSMPASHFKLPLRVSFCTNDRKKEPALKESNGTDIDNREAHKFSSSYVLLIFSLIGFHNLDQQEVNQE